MKVCVKLFIVFFIFGFGVVNGQDMVRRLTDLFDGSGDSCGEHSTFVNETCQCDPGYVESEGICVQELCSNATCPENSNCTAVNATQYICECSEGFIGADCFKDPCLAEDCSDHGNCTAACDENGCAAKCNCNADSFGSTCSSLKYCSTEKPCNGNECTQGENPNEFTCTCTEKWTGTYCDISICPEEGGYPATPAGQSAASNETCQGGEFDGKPTGSRDCDLKDGSATWQDELTLNCSASLGNIENTEEKAVALEVLTSDPSQVSSGEVEEFSQVLLEVSSSENMTTETAESSISAITNLMSANDSEAVAASSDVIVESISNIGANVPLSEDPTLPGVSQYTQVESTLGLFVMDVTPTFFATVFTGWSLHIDKLLSSEDQFAGVSPTLGKDPATFTGTNYITVASGEKVVFTMYANDALFNDQSFINSVLFGVDIVGNVTLKFQLLQWHDLDSNGVYDNGTHLTWAECVDWRDSSWQVSGCTPTVAFEQANVFLLCKCSKTNGTFAARMVTNSTFASSESTPQLATSPHTETTTTSTPGGGGWEDWMIAPIVVGAVALIAIAGAIYYFCFKKKKDNKNKVENIEVPEITKSKVKDDDKRDSSDDEERPQSRTAWTENN